MKTHVNLFIHLWVVWLFPPRNYTLSRSGVEELVIYEDNFDSSVIRPLFRDPDLRSRRRSVVTIIPVRQSVGSGVKEREPEGHMG